MPTKQSHSQNYWGNPQAHVPHSYRATGAAADFLPVSVAEVKANLRITWETEDALLATYVTIAEAILAEDLPELVLRETPMLLSLDEFPNEIQLVMFPVQSVESVTYYDLDNEAQELTADEDYTVDLNSFPARIWSTVDLSRNPTARFWPDVFQRPGAVSVAYTAGYADAAAVNPVYKQLLHLWVSHLYNNRAPVEQGRPASVPYTIEYLLATVRKRRLA